MLMKNVNTQPGDAVMRIKHIFLAFLLPMLLHSGYANGFNVTYISTNVTCNGLSNGEITIQPQGGVSPYQYSIDGGITFQLADYFVGLSGGTYPLLVIDAVSDSGQTVANVFEPTQLSLGVPLNIGICSGDTTNLCPTAIGGTPPYNYSWNGGALTPFPCLYTSVVAQYSIVVTDVNGCTAFLSFTPASYPSPSFSGILNNAITCPGVSANVCIPSVTGGSLPYSYLWSTGAITTCQNLFAGTYTFSVYDANGCSVSGSTSVTNSQGWSSKQLDNVTLPTCGACDGIATVTVNGGSPVATYLWMPGAVTTPTNYYLCDNTPSYVLISDTAGCVDSLSFTLSCRAVWPGDANNDGVANNVDLLAIGVGYGTMDVARPNATINWQAEAYVNWADTLSDGTNYKHIDCNGDGIIADDDTIAILQNFGLSHPLRVGSQQQSLTDPPLFFDIVIDTVGTSQQLTIPLELGSAALPMNNIYGIAFTINYDTTLVKADSVSLNFPYCWLGNYGTEAISIYKNDPLNGKLYAAITRITHSDTSGYGEIARFTVVTTDNVAGRLMSPVYDTISFPISDVMAIDFDQNLKGVTILNDSLVIEDLTAIRALDLLKDIVFYPNPVTDVLRFSLPDNVVVKKIELFNSLGQTASYNCKNLNNHFAVVMGENTKGNYDMRITTNRGVIVKSIHLLGK